jgi:NAD(P)-dependent dehydrogenase (short-subunit alcohol dehydrogenase family)
MHEESAMNPVPTVLVTGASRGLGRGIAVEAAAQGLSVAINYASNAEAAEETAGLCRRAAATPQQRFVPVRGDIGRTGDRTELLARTLDAFGRLDALVNNAGIAPRVRADLTQTTEASFEEVLRINLQGPHFLTQAVANHWLEQRYPSALSGGFKIVFVTSISADTASVNRGEYCISKAGLAMASQLWAVRLADQGVQVLELRPGIMATDMTANVKEKYDALIADGLVPQRRWGTAEDVGRAVRAVLAGHFPFTTGEVIHLDGGFHLRRL